MDSLDSVPYLHDAGSVESCPSKARVPFNPTSLMRPKAPKPFFRSGLGALYAGDCVTLLKTVKDEVVDTVFADPPFNLGKEYGRSFKDEMPDQIYVRWCKEWLAECIRVLKPGGALFLYNLPRWNIVLGAWLMEQGLTFRHDITIVMNPGLPVPGRLYPAHYSMLYFTKGKPQTFRRIRTPIETCRHCNGELRDYGGHRSAMNPLGVNLKDVWTDIPPVRHWKFKSQTRKCNALSTKILDRVIEMSTYPGDIVLDPFGGSGTTFAVAESKHRHWLGIELDFCPTIVERLTSDAVQPHKNRDVVQD